MLHTHKNPCPRFTIGCIGEAAAASLTMDHTSCCWFATRLAGANLASILAVEEMLRRRMLDRVNQGGLAEDGSSARMA